MIGAGTNRINTCTVAKASQGLANYVLKKYTNNRSIAIAYDSRIKSDLFSVTAARVFAANGIKTYIFPEPMPTPCLSYAVREIGCSAGIVITASHNPCNYNGYKVYGSESVRAVRSRNSRYTFRKQAIKKMMHISSKGKSKKP